jgi:hypothetical protein
LKFQEEFLKKWITIDLDFIGQSDQHKKKYRLAKWSIICQPQDPGGRGLGIQNIDIQNHCLLNKWLFKIINEDGLWQQVLKKKYVKDSTIGQVHQKQGDSHF